MFRPGGIRAGLAFQIKDIYGVSEIVKREEYIESRLRRELPNHPNLIVLGPPTELVTARIPIISFLIKCGKKFLHHNFVSAVLNDVYGIQTRSGCMCAGPYASRLFGLAPGVIDALSDQIHDLQYLKPGFIRLSLVYFNSNAALDFIIGSLLEVAEHAWKLLPQYRFDAETSNWVHVRRGGGKKETFLLPVFSLLSGSGGSADVEAGAGGKKEVVVAGAASDADVMNHIREYYRSILSQSHLLYQACHALYTERATADAEKEGGSSWASDEYGEVVVPDLQAELYAGARGQFAWFVFPQEVLRSARRVAAARQSHWVSPLPLPDEEEGDEGEGEDCPCFLKPELYWPAVCQRWSETQGPQ